MKIDAIHLINWKIGLTVAEAEENNWQINESLPDWNGGILICSAAWVNGLFPDIKFWSISDSKGKSSTHAYKGFRPMLSCIQRNIEVSGAENNFDAGADLLAAIVLSLGWAPEELFILPKYRIEEAVGHSYGGTLDAHENENWNFKLKGMKPSPIKDELRKYPKNTIIVHRATFCGEADISLADVKKMDCFPGIDGFEPNDRLESMRVYYRFLH